MSLRTARLCLLLPVLLTAAAVAAQAADTFVAGDWSVDVTAAGPGQIRYRGEPVTTQGGFSGFLPNWQGERFSMQACGVTRSRQGVTWRKAVNGNQEAALSLQFRPDGFRFALTGSVSVPGPSEFSISIVPEAVRTSADHCLTWVDDELQSLPLGWPFDTVRGARALRFEQPERTVTFRCPGMDLQDRRAGGGGMFLVQVISPTSGFPVKTESFIDCAITAADPRQAEGRRAILALQPEELLPAAVPGAGFEADEPAGEWTENPPSAVDAQGPHKGKSALRLSITRAQAPTANPYVTQLIPVEAHRLYQASAWVRSEAVEPVAIGDRSPTGGTVILEFADKQGNWLAGGSYAAGLYGTQGYRHVVTDAALAPEGAGYAIIFLALRGAGTAWFDDVALREVRKHVFPLTPLPETTVCDNTPTLNWYCGVKAPAVVELSQDPGFPAGAVISRSLSARPPLTLDRTLPPGRWLWRVRVPQVNIVSPAWAFTQSAPLTQDTTEPVVAERHGFLARADDAVIVRYSDNVGVTAVALIVDGVAVQPQYRSGTAARYTPSRGWQPGLHKVRVTVRDAAGNSASRLLFFTHCPPQPRTAWQRFGGVTRDGRKRFLFGLYGVQETDMKEVAAAGFDFVHSYRWDGAGSTAEARQYMNEAHRYGLQAFMGLQRARLMKGDEEFVAERVGALMTHPGLFAWYLYDEPDIDSQYVSPEAMLRYYRLIKALDPFHPVILTCAGDSAVPLYRDACDVYWPQVYSGAAFVADRLDRTRTYLRPGKPVMAILHCYDNVLTELRRQGQPVDDSKFQPDPLTLRGNAFMALAHNSSCLNWWEYEKQSPQFYSVGHNAAGWAALKRTIADIKSLEPVLTAEGEIRTWVERPAQGREVHCWEKRLADRTVLIAVNRDRETCEVTLAPQLVPADSDLQVLFEQRPVRLEGQKLKERFGPLEVHVYEWRR